MSTLLLTLALLPSPQAPLAPAPVPSSQGTTDHEPAVEWQRSLASALAVQKATGKPLLICVNTDGEVFCDRFAGTTYRDPEFVASTRGYVCVVASPDRHNDSDYDGLGRRIECPRFPGCTCSEHISIEPGLFERWFGGERYAPRHVAVAPDGKVLFDHYLDRSMQDAIDDIAAHRGDGRDRPVPDDAEGLLERSDAASRRALERRYLDADGAGRTRLLELAGRAANRPFDLLRLGLREDDDGLFVAAARSLCRLATAETAIDLEDALARCDDEDLRIALLAACARVATDSPAMARFVSHHGAAHRGHERAGEAAFATTRDALPAVDRTTLEDAVDAAERGVREHPDDAARLLDLARANLDLADFLLPGGGPMTPLLYEDARRAAERAAAGTGAEARQALGIQAVALWQLGNADAARGLATAALAGAGTDVALTDAPWPRVLGVAARSAAASVYAAAQDDAEAQVPDAVADAAFAYGALVRHPAAEERDLREAAALYAFAGARRLAQEILAEAVRRMPWSRDLHDDYRRRIVADRGAEALRRRYAGFAAAADDRATGEWYAGYAALVAAELHVRDRRPQLAEAAYTDCIERFARSAAQNADYADSANHFAVLALTGRALLRYDRGQAPAAVEDLLAAASLRPASMGETDGLGRKPQSVLRRIADELTAAGETELAERLSDGQ